MNTRYCDFCGSVPIPREQTEGWCENCRAWLTGYLAAGYYAWQEYKREHPMCCGDLLLPDPYHPTREPHLTFHGQEATDYYPKLSKPGDVLRTEVDVVLNFYHDRLTTSYRADYGEEVQDTEYGEDIPYSTPDFWTQVWMRMDQAAEAAWNADVLTCPVCGYNLFGPNGDHEHEEEDEG